MDDFFHDHNADQSVVILTTFQDEHGEPYVVLGRGDPRFKDTDGKSLSPNPEDHPRVTHLKFVGGGVDTPEPEHIENFKKLAAIRYERCPSWTRQFGDVLAINVMKELAEEANISADTFAKPPLDTVINQTSLHFLTTVKGSQSRRFKEQQIHYFHLDLGTLSERQIEALHRVTNIHPNKATSIHPDDDLIQTVIAPAKALHCDLSGQVSLSLSDARITTKTHFDGFHEMDLWQKRWEQGLAQNLHPEIHERIITNRHNMTRIHNEVRGLQGVHMETLFGCGPVPLFGDIHHGDNSQILMQVLRNRYKFMILPTGDVPKSCPPVLDSPIGEWTIKARRRGSPDTQIE